LDGQRILDSAGPSTVADKENADPTAITARSNLMVTASWESEGLTTRTLPDAKVPPKVEQAFLRWA